MSPFITAFRPHVHFSSQGQLSVKPALHTYPPRPNPAGHAGRQSGSCHAFTSHPAALSLCSSLHRPPQSFAPRFLVNEKEVKGKTLNQTIRHAILLNNRYEEWNCYQQDNFPPREWSCCPSCQTLQRLWLPHPQWKSTRSTWRSGSGTTKCCPTANSPMHIQPESNNVEKEPRSWWAPS